jgi:hypothetical protein
MECPICYTNEPSYVINCGSTVEHAVCDTCEVTMRMKEPVTSKGRILKCPMCRVPEKAPGKRSAFSYEHELSYLYRVTCPPVPRPVPRPRTEDWAAVADRIRDLPIFTQRRYINTYPQLAPYFENYVPHRLAREAAIAEVERQPFAAQVAPATRAAMRPPAPVVVNAFCQSGRRETGVCQTRSKTKRKCTYSGCDKFVCRSCRQCLTH